VTQSNEADDERSEGGEDDDSDLLSMGPDSTIRDAMERPMYEGDDTRFTSGKELRGFFMYGWAAEVFVVCGMGSFIPITLEQLARERGHLEHDRSTSCTADFNVPNPFPNTTMAYTKPPSGDAQQCVVDILGLEINTASFAMYTFSISVLIQALLIISMSGAADHGRFRKTFLIIFAFLGSIATMLFLPIVPKVLVLGAILAIIANTCFGASFVLLNSFLPLLVRHHPDVLLEDSSEDEWSEGNSLNHEEQQEEVIAEETSALLSRTNTILKNNYPPSPISTSKELRLSTRISSYGIGIGYIAALIVQAGAITAVRLMHSSLFSLRVALFIIGAWWFIFTIPVAFWLRARPGPPLHLDPGQSNIAAAWSYFKYSWKSLWRSVRHARQLKDVLLFLGAWFMISDAVATVSGTAILFAKTSLEMKPASLALITVTATVSGIAGAFTWSKLSVMAGLRPGQTILACICLFELIPIYGLLGYIPAIRRLGVLGLQQPWEMYPLGAVYGFVMGGLSSFCRSLFGELIPPGFEATFYALYAITDKGSSIFGPAIVGAITDATGEIRPVSILS
jgi:UMF1 family MFS transporter